MLSDSISEKIVDQVQSEQSTPAVNISEPVQQMPHEEYGIITGSFKSESNALLLVKKLAGEGYSAEIIQGANGFYRVSALRCKSLSEAESVKNSMEARYPGAWIVKLK